MIDKEFKHKCYTDFSYFQLDVSTRSKLKKVKKEFKQARVI